MALSKVKNQKLRLQNPQCLPWISNPFTKHNHSLNPESQSLMTHHPEKSIDDIIESQTTQERLGEAEEIEEATPIELFYDLFFVANLTTVTSVHYITERTTLSSYILYFIILWFTWLHVTLLDVRFSVDSVYERVCKALHFGAMAAFASVSTNWNPVNPGTAETVDAMRTMTLTLMFSRVVLAVQYAVVAWFGRKKAVVPLLVHVGAMAVASGVYLGLYFTFTRNGSRSYIAWYGVALFEVVAVALVAMSKSVCFLRTHLVERMGLLTLIILGEGIIVMLKAINTVVKGFGWKGNTFAVVVSALALIYFYWMFYFDMAPRKIHFGKFRQQIWTLLHFPFHLALVLSVEGLRQLTTLYNYQLMSSNMINSFIGPSAPTDPSELLSQFNITFQMFYDDTYAKTVLKDWPLITNWTLELRDLFAGNSTLTSTKTDHIISNLTAEMTPEAVESHIKNPRIMIMKSKLVMKAAECLPEFYGFKLPYRKSAEIGDKYRDFRGLFDLVFKYFFLSLAVVFILYAVFVFMARRRMDFFDWVAVALRIVPAIIFCGMATLPSSHALYDYKHGAWPIPQIALLVFIVLVIDKAINWLTVKRAK